MSTDYPICRAATVCPLCGHEKDTGLLMCWPCHRGGRHIPHFGKVALDRFENSPRRIAEAKPDRSTSYETALRDALHDAQVMIANLLQQGGTIRYEHKGQWQTLEQDLRNLLNREDCSYWRKP